MQEQLVELPHSPYAALWATLDKDALAIAETRGWHELKPNQEPPYEEWLGHIILAGGHFMLRRDAFELATWLGDNELMGRLFDALPWAGDTLAPLTLEEVKADLRAFIAPIQETIADENQSEIPWHAAQAA
jgi:hypothetical protein